MPDLQLTQDKGALIVALLQGYGERVILDDFHGDLRNS